MLKLISSKPSPYARKVRIALAEKSIPFELISEVPWESTTQAPRYNPLEKLPVLIFPNGKAIYESHYVLEYLEAKSTASPLLPKGPNSIDAALSFFEAQREHDERSELWMARQRRKIDGGLEALADWLAESGDQQFLVDNTFSIADIAAGSCLGYMKVRFPEHPWRTAYPHLDRYSERLEERQSFRDTVPGPQTFSERII